MSEGKIMTRLIRLPEKGGDCWKWLGCIHKDTGYGKKQLNGKSVLAHRWVYSIFHGHIPSNYVLDHTCSNRWCVNPNHLEVVNQAENCRRGEGTTLTEDQVIEIKIKLKTIKWGEKKVIAKEYNVSAALISDIQYGRAWADIQV